MQKKPVIPQYLADLIEDALHAARMESFGVMDEKETKHLVEGTRIYRETWLIEPLETALRAAYGDEEAIRWAKEKVSHSYNDRDLRFRGELNKEADHE